MPGDTHRRYPPELRERAVRMVAEIRAEHDSEWAAMARVSQLLGVGTPETVRKWVRRAEVDQGARPGTSSEESAEVRRLRREVAELRRANAILRSASVFFAAELDRPQR
jgi:transposase